MTNDMPSFENFKGFILTIFTNNDFIGLMPFSDRKTVLDFFIKHENFFKSPRDLIELISAYNLQNTPYSFVKAKLVLPMVLKQIGNKSEEILNSLKKSENKEEIEFSKMLYNLEIFSDSKFDEIRAWLNE